MAKAQTRYQTVTNVFGGKDDGHIHWQCATCNMWIHAPNTKGLVARCRLCGTRSTVTTKPGWGQGRNVVAIGGGKQPVTEGEIYQALRQRHPEPEWVYLSQVRTQTGYTERVDDFDSVRYLDAFAMNCFGSKGFTRVAYEIKVSRSDWLRELEDPRKRAQGYFLCNEFWFAVAPGVYQAGDEGSVTVRKRTYSNPLDGCGVIQVEEDGTLTTLRRARRHEAWPMPIGFIASLLRNYVSAQQTREQVAIAEALGSVSVAEAEILALPLWEVTA